MRASDILQEFVDEYDGNGEPKHSHPLIVVQSRDCERLGEGWDVHDDEVETHAEDDGEEEPHVRCRRVREQRLVLAQRVQSVEHLNQDEC